MRFQEACYVFCNYVASFQSRTIQRSKDGCERRVGSLNESKAVGLIEKDNTRQTFKGKSPLSREIRREPKCVSLLMELELLWMRYRGKTMEDAAKRGVSLLAIILSAIGCGATTLLVNIEA